jgi:uncharacterized protein with HEPN domain
MPANDKTALQDMLKAAALILEFARDSSLEELASNQMRLSAVLYQIVILGEGARRLSAQLRQAHPEVPWAEIIGMRSILVHEYDGVVASEVWQVIQRDLKELVPRIESMLNSL